MRETRWAYALGSVRPFFFCRHARRGMPTRTWAWHPAILGRPPGVKRLRGPSVRDVEKPVVVASGVAAMVCGTAWSARLDTPRTACKIANHAGRMTGPRPPRSLLALMSLHAVFERRRAARLAAPPSRVLASVPIREGFWTRDLISSPSATAAAVSALVVAEQHFDDVPQVGPPMNDSWTPGALFRGEFTQLVVQNLRWLSERQNADGGWAEAEGGRSTLAATLMVQSAFQLTGVPAKAVGLLDRSAEYVKQSGGVAAFRTAYADDQALMASVLTSCALADIAPWRRVPQLSWSAITRLMQRRSAALQSTEEPVAPLLAAGLARFRHAPPLNPLRRLATRFVQKPAVSALEGLQGMNGGFMESIPQTGFVVLSLGGAGLHDHPIVRRGVEFLLSTVLSTGGWPSRRLAA
jgi:hypothetical protein